MTPSHSRGQQASPTSRHNARYNLVAFSQFSILGTAQRLAGLWHLRAFPGTLWSYSLTGMRCSTSVDARAASRVIPFVVLYRWSTTSCVESNTVLRQSIGAFFPRPCQRRLRLLRRLNARRFPGSSRSSRNSFSFRAIPFSLVRPRTILARPFGVSLKRFERSLPLSLVLVLCVLTLPLSVALYLLTRAHPSSRHAWHLTNGTCCCLTVRVANGKSQPHTVHTGMRICTLSPRDCCQNNPQDCIRVARVATQPFLCMSAVG